MEPNIVFEDQAVLVCIKPAGVPTQTSRLGSPDMVSILKNHIYQTSGKKKAPYLAVIHRLDQPVEGLLVFAKTPKAAKDLNRQLSSSGFGKYYLAVLSGIPENRDAFLECDMVKDGRTNTSHICSPDTPGARHARLHYRILSIKTLEKDPEFFRSRTTDPDAGFSGPFAVAEIKLDTGRHHQIRVQMASIGCPIAGDRKYGTNGDAFRQLQLFACRLEFLHPDTHKPMSFSHKPF